MLLCFVVADYILFEVYYSVITVSHSIVTSDIVTSLIFFNRLYCYSCNVIYIVITISELHRFCCLSIATTGLEIQRERGPKSQADVR